MRRVLGVGRPVTRNLARCGQPPNTAGVPACVVRVAAKVSDRQSFAAATSLQRVLCRSGKETLLRRLARRPARGRRRYKVSDRSYQIPERHYNTLEILRD